MQALCKHLIKNTMKENIFHCGVCEFDLLHFPYIITILIIKLQVYKK